MSTFLSPLRSRDPRALVIRNQRTGAVVASHVLPALDSETRRTGLLKHTGLAAHEAMVIAPTNAIHTFFMKFPIDVAFVGKDGRILKIRAALPAWRMSGAWGGYAVIEMAAGAFAAAGTAVGDIVCIEPAATATPRHAGF
jgi:uncharacterized membrane protein (UPF0127 family)